MSDVEFCFEIGALSPQTFPMERLGQYIADLGAMLGESEFVHFLRLEAGSTRIIHKVQGEALPRIEAGLNALNGGVAEAVRQKAFASLNRRLKEDDAIGVYTRADTGVVLLDFSGAETLKPEVLGPIDQSTVIDGVVISLGDSRKKAVEKNSKTTRVLVRSGDEVLRLSATRDMARQLGPHIFGQELRLTGKGRWFRCERDGWRLDRFMIESFEALRDEDLLATVAELRAIEGEWRNLDHWRDPHAIDED